MKDFISKVDKSWSLFLDRDGVINKRIFGGYVSKISEWEFIAGVPEAIARLTEIFGHIFVVTNQQGIGKGLMSLDDLENIHEHFLHEINRAGGNITKIYFCAMLAKQDNNCRKPSPYMAFKAKEDYPGIELEKSIMIGDSRSDILFGKNSGMYTVLHLSKEETNIKADMDIDSLLDFASLFN